MFFILALIVFVIFIVIDLIWLGYVGRGLYQKYIGHLLKKDVNWTAALLFYGLFVLGLTFFAVEPAISQGGLIDALFLGGFFGLLMYATYDLTNLATLEGWSVPITVIDLIWGTFLGATVSGLTYVVAEWIWVVG